MSGETVVKVGGGLLGHASTLDGVLGIIGAVARHRRLLLVPGGGPFADAIREVDGRIGLSDDAAHWMAVLAMDQYAHLIASRLGGAVIIEQPQDLVIARSGQIPVLAPSRWLRQVDPLPHSWAVTSDSVAAWIATEIAASRLVLVKPPGAAGPDVVDAHFARVRSSSTPCVVIAADRLDDLRAALEGTDVA